MFEYCKKNSTEHNFNKDKQIAGWDFVCGFLERHPRLSLWWPEAVCINRVFWPQKKFNETELWQFSICHR